MPLKDRRQEFSWPDSAITDVQLIPERREYKRAEAVALNFGFRVVGGVREAFHPDVWTVAWEDFDKIQRLTMRSSVGELRAGILSKNLVEVKKEVRRASFYWSRDPDLPYRIWVMVMHEDRSAPKIPLNVEDAKSKMFDIVKHFEIPASTLGSGTHKLFASARVEWGRHSYIEKGQLGAKSKEVSVKVE
jgi:hypothetical protein